MTWLQVKRIILKLMIVGGIIVQDVVVIAMVACLGAWNELMEINDRGR